MLTFILLKLYELSADNIIESPIAVGFSAIPLYK